METKASSRIISLLLAVVLIFGTFSLAAYASLSNITPGSGRLPDGTVGVAYATTLGASSSIGASKIQWSMGSSGTLPPGLSLGASTGVISGTPTQEGDYNFNVVVTDTGDNDTSTVNYAIRINPAASTTPPVTSVSLNKTNMALFVGGTETLTATIDPNNATNKNVTWSSSNTSVATVSSSGLVTAVAVGTTTITVTTVDGGFTAICSVMVNPVAVTGVSLNKTSTTLGINQTEQLSAEVLPSNAANKNVTWTSNNPSVATVSSSGLVTAKAGGTATITVTTVDGGFTAICSVTVTTSPIKVTEVRLKSSTTLGVGQTEQLLAEVLPSNAANKNVTWSSSNSSVATVSSSGLVTAKAEGTAKITVTTVDGGFTAQCAVTVIAGKVITGKVSVYGAGIKGATGATITVYTDTNVSVGTATAGSDGNYSVNVPANIAHTAKNYKINAVPTGSIYPGMPRMRLNVAEDALESGARLVSATNAHSGNSNATNFNFVDPPKVKGKITSVTGQPISDLYVSVWDSVKTAKDGTFMAQSYVTTTGNQTISIGAYPSGYYGKYFSKTFNVTADVLKSGVLDMGTMELTPIVNNPTFPFATNGITLMPSSVSSGETSNATVNVNATQNVSDAKIEITVDNGAVIRANSDNLVRVTEAGKQVAFKSRILSSNGSTLTITLDLKANTQYQITFGIQAPDLSASASGYTAQAKVNGTLIGMKDVAIHNLSVNAPAEISFADKFTIKGEVVSSGDVKLVLDLISPTGDTLSFSRETMNNVGYFYAFENIQFPTGQQNKYPYGEYTVRVQMLTKQGNNPIAEASTTMRITDKPVSMKSMLLRDDFNTVSVINPTPGDVISFVGWVDGNVNSMDYRNLKAEVSLNNADQVQSAKFIMETTHGKFEWNATKSDDSFSAFLTKYQGTGKASVKVAITKKGGSVITYTIGQIVILIDPSGYVYDVRTGNRIANAEATLYYFDSITNDWELWPADQFMQINPQKTDDHGEYGWMVPEGRYKIIVEKDGYATFDTYETFGSPYKDITVLPERKDVNIGLTPIYTSGSGSSSSSSSSGGYSGGGGSVSVGPQTVTTAQAYIAVSSAVRIARAKSTDVATIKLRNSGVISLDIMKSMVKQAGMSLLVHADSLSANGKAVDVRIAFDPSKATKDINLSGSTYNTSAINAKNRLAKWFSNQIVVISLSQKVDFGMEVNVAAKVNLDGMDTKNLYIYSYDATTNTYRLVTTKYTIDVNGYLHFTTSYAGDIIVSDGPLKLK